MNVPSALVPSTWFTRTVGFLFLATAAFVTAEQLAEQHTLFTASSLPLAPVLGSRSASLSTMSRPVAVFLDSALLGRSRKLRMHLVAPASGFVLPALEEAFGSEAAREPGVYSTTDSATGPFAFIRLRPFSDKIGEYVGTYHIGFWPAELHAARSAAYENPDGFIEVTPDNQDTPISAHFRLRDFLTHDQRDVWPKYLVLREALLDKLELVLDDLEAHGVVVEHATILSGFRSPQYNVALGDASGRARESRHQFGDASDVIIDNDRNGRMDDINHDGVVDTKDIDIVLSAVERVELQHPELIGGLGRYHATGPSGPFVHMDVRGYKARWNNDRRSRYVTARGRRNGRPYISGNGASASTCRATGAMAALCRGVR